MRLCPAGHRETRQTIKKKRSCTLSCQSQHVGRKRIKGGATDLPERPHRRQEHKEGGGGDKGKEDKRVVQTQDLKSKLQQVPQMQCDRTAGERRQRTTHAQFVAAAAACCRGPREGDTNHASLTAASTECICSKAMYVCCCACTHGGDGCMYVWMYLQVCKSSGAR